MTDSRLPGTYCPACGATWEHRHWYPEDVVSASSPNQRFWTWRPDPVGQASDTLNRDDTYADKLSENFRSWP